MSLFNKNSKKFLDVGCYEGGYFFRFCLNHPENFYYLVDIEDCFFTRMDSPQRVYNYLKAIGVGRIFKKVQIEPRLLFNIRNPHMFYPQSKPFIEIIDENFSELFKSKKSAYEYIAELKVSDVFGRGDFPETIELIRKSNYYKRSFMDFLYSKLSLGFRLYLYEHTGRMKFFQADATKKLPFRSKYFDRVYACEIPKDIQQSIYSEAIRLSKENKVRTQYVY